jgi:hypothetical protein
MISIKTFIIKEAQVLKKTRDWIWQTIVGWLNDIPKGNQDPQMVNDFSRLLKALKPADVILFEGRTRVSEVIKIITLSPWTHAALYIGCLNDIKNPATRRIVLKHYQGDVDKPLIIESLLGKGTIVTPLSDYYDDNLRVCRPLGLHASDQKKVVRFAAEHLGMNYDVRQLLDLARFMFPYGILPRKWRSSLFQHNAGRPTNIICSSMIARCFQSIHYPITPIIKADNNDRVKFHKRDFRLFVPSDFDYSPSFQILKFPTWPLLMKGAYRNLPWEEENPRKSKSPQETEKTMQKQQSALSLLYEKTRHKLTRKPL